MPRAARKKRPAAATSHAERVLHGFASPALLDERGVLTLVKGKGAYVWDAEGRKYLDGLAGLWNVAVGYGRAEIGAAMAAQTRELSYAPTLLGFSSLPAQQLAARFVAQLRERWQ